MWIGLSSAALGLSMALCWGFIWPGPSRVVDPASTQTLATPSKAELQARTLAPVAVPAAHKTSIEIASIEQLIAGKGKASDWRVARLQSNEFVLVIEFPNLLEQSLAFNRTAAFIEKKRSAGDRVLTDLELAALVKQSGDTGETFLFGHDYTAEQMRQFFSQAERQKIGLNPQELRLRAVLLEAQLLQETEGSSGHTASRLHANGQQAVVSFSAIQADDPTTDVNEEVDAVRRESTLRHELSHGEFFTRPLYQKQSWAFWQKGLSSAERALFRHVLARMDYDPNNEPLMVNETQAFLMHTPDARAFDASHLGLTQAQLQVLRSRFERSR